MVGEVLYQQLRAKKKQTILQEAEEKLARKLINILDEKEGDLVTQGKEAISEGIERLENLWAAIRQFPSIYSNESLGKRTRSFETLVETFSHVNPYASEAYLPTRAVLGRGYAVAKYNFCRLLGVVVEEFLADSEESIEEIREEVESVTRAAVLTVIAEDLLMSIAGDSRLEDPLRRRAALVVAELWEERSVDAIEEFFNFLISIWDAKASVKINYGTLAGIAEMFCLARAGCDPEFLSFFCRDDVGEDEHAALLEFMFNATYEELEIMRRYMKEHGIKALAAEDVAKIFNVPVCKLHLTTHTPADVFFTFRERQTMAAHRLLRGLPGPKKTAEEYVMIYFLRRDIQGKKEKHSKTNKLG